MAGVQRACLRGAVTPEPGAPAWSARETDGRLVRCWQLPWPLDVPLTLSVHRRGRGDPTFHLDPTGAVWRTSLTPDGPGTLRVAGAASPAGTVTATGWGPGARWLLDTLPDLLGAGDDPSAFRPEQPLLRRLTRRYAAMRIGRTGRVLEALVPAVLEQKVVTVEAHRAWRVLLSSFGAPAPGPAPDRMRVFPPPRVWATIPSWEWHRAGVEPARAHTVAAVAARAGRIEQTLTLDVPAAKRALLSLQGVGPWTVAEVRQRAAGDPDAVSVGDANLPAAVGWALAGRVVDDAGMLALLAPHAGHRYRVTRLVELSGLRPPRRGPRLAPRNYRGW